MIASYQVTGVADFAKKMEEEGECIVLACQLLLPCRVGKYVRILASLKLGLGGRTEAAVKM